MGVALDDLWSQVFRCATESGSGFTRVGEELGQAEISQLDVAILIDENILGFQVSVDNLVLVKDTDCEHELGSVELDCFLWEAFDFEKVGVQVSTPDVLEKEVDSIFILEDIVHSKQERMI